MYAISFIKGNGCLEARETSNLMGEGSLPSLSKWPRADAILFGRWLANSKTLDDRDKFFLGQMFAAFQLERESHYREVEEKENKRQLRNARKQRSKLLTPSSQ